MTIATARVHAHGARYLQQRRRAKRFERLKGVVPSHLGRFAFREAPLPSNWSARGADPWSREFGMAAENLFVS